MGMHQNFTDILNVIYNDETLLRLLYYSPANLATNTPDPLDPSLTNILSIDEETRWNIINERVLFVPKTNDLTSDNPICRLLLYAGRRTPETNNYMMADQELAIDILCHFSFENGDLRSLRISDRLNQLLCLEKITGIGKTNFIGGGQINGLPTEYIGYHMLFNFGEFKK